MFAVFVCRLFSSPRPSPGPKGMLFVYSSQCCALSIFFLWLLFPPLRARKAYYCHKRATITVNAADAFNVNIAVFLSGLLSPSQSPKGRPIVANAAIDSTIFFVATFPALRFRKGTLWWPLLCFCRLRVSTLSSPRPSLGPKEMLFVYSSRRCTISVFFLWLLFPL